LRRNGWNPTGSGAKRLYPAANSDEILPFPNKLSVGF
jgi:hypothetical protein